MTRDGKVAKERTIHPHRAQVADADGDACNEGVPSEVGRAEHPSQERACRAKRHPPKDARQKHPARASGRRRLATAREDPRQTWTADAFGARWICRVLSEVVVLCGVTVSHRITLPFSRRHRSTRGPARDTLSLPPAGYHLDCTTTRAPTAALTRGATPPRAVVPPLDPIREPAAETAQARR